MDKIKEHKKIQSDAIKKYKDLALGLCNTKFPITLKNIDSLNDQFRISISKFDRFFNETILKRLDMNIRLILTTDMSQGIIKSVFDDIKCCIDLICDESFNNIITEIESISSKELKEKYKRMLNEYIEGLKQEIRNRINKIISTSMPCIILSINDFISECLEKVNTKLGNINISLSKIRNLVENIISKKLESDEPCNSDIIVDLIILNLYSVPNISNVGYQVTDESNIHVKVIAT